MSPTALPWAGAVSALTFRLVFLSLLALLHPFPCIVSPATTSPGRGPAMTPVINKLRLPSIQSGTPSRYTTEDDRISFATEQDSQDAGEYVEEGSPGILQEQDLNDGWDEADDIEQDLYDLERELEEANEARAVAEQVWQEFASCSLSRLVPETEGSVQEMHVTL